MTDLSPGNGYGIGSAPIKLADTAAEDQVRNSSPAVARSSSERSHTTMQRPVPTVSLVIPVRNEARNIAWVLEQIADDIDEIILVEGNSTDATLITARSYRPDVKVVPQEGVGKGSALRTGFLALRTGFLAATGDIIVTTDADGSRLIVGPTTASAFDTWESINGAFTA